MTLISGDQTFLIWGMLTALVGFGFWAEQHTKIGAKLTGIVVTMSAAMLLANIRVLPIESQVYDNIFSFLLPTAIPLLLFRADIRRIINEAGQTLVAFILGVIGVLLGVLTAHFLIPVGEFAAETAGLYTATYIGGSANFAAVTVASEFQKGSELTALIAADIIATNIQLIVLIALPSILIIKQYFPAELTRTEKVEKQADKNMPYIIKSLNLTGLALSLTLAIFLVVLGKWMAMLSGSDAMAILFTTAFALIIANLMPGV
ncbi:MAG: DUF819 family protein, partial [Gammaproteobacteria bacterium]|nr:DUF819 family protein [Gammaproteobacteria bacterium]